jgi:hypothetical protein
MKTILENWREYLTEEKKIINSKEKLIKIVNDNPDQEIFLDNPKGTTKKFGGVDPIELPFNYGEYPELINPADGMGWDIVIVPSSNEDDKDLLPVGHVSYSGDEEEWEENSSREMPKDLVDNHKIIVASGGNYTAEDKTLITSFFKQRWQFEEVAWYE